MMDPRWPDLDHPGVAITKWTNHRVLGQVSELQGTQMHRLMPTQHLFAVSRTLDLVAQLIVLRLPFEFRLDTEKHVADVDVRGALQTRHHGGFA